MDGAIRMLSARRGFTHDGYVKIGEEIYPCQLTAMSSAGATLNFEGPVDLPERFTIQLTRDGKVTRDCVVWWYEGTRMEVIFRTAEANPD
jgi:hypothetical protein